MYNIIIIISVLILTLVSVLVVTLAAGDDKWAWGKEKSEPVKRSDDVVSIPTPIPEIKSTQQASESQVDGKNAPLPQARTAGLFKKLACKVGLCKDDDDEYGNYPGPYPPPYPPPYPAPYPGPYPGQYPPYPQPAPIPVAIPVPIYTSESQLIQGPVVESYPISIDESNGYYGLPPVAEGYPPNKGYPPIEGYPPKQIITDQIYQPEPTEHHHTHVHTHIHNNAGLNQKPIYKPPYRGDSVKPYKGDAIKPYKGFAPTIVNGGGNRLPPLVGTPEVDTSTLYRPSGSYYGEQCQCVSFEYCSPYDVVKSGLGKDLLHLISPRNEESKLLAVSTNATEAYKTKVKRDAQVQNKLPLSSSNTPKGRALIGHEPGISGCGNGYVCCRNPISQSHQPRTGVCGKSVTSSIHGRVATTDYDKGTTEFGQYPWQAALLKEDKYESVFVCGGTLISERHVLTAAHCLKDIIVPYLKVRLGEWDVNSEKEFYPHKEFKVENIQVHPKFYPGNLENDIAVITLHGYVDFYAQPHIAPICLPNPYQEFTHTKCYVTGWGKDAFGNKGEFQRILKEVHVPVVDSRTCEYALQRTRLGPHYHLPKGFLCAGGEPGKDTCKGDGGGPLVCTDGRYNTFQLAGLVSWGIDCGLPGVPGVYVDVPYYIDWIKSIVKY